MSNEQKLIEIQNLSKYFKVKKGILNRNATYLKAVDNVSLYINKGETLGLVGESGCGKSTLGRTVMKLYEPTSGKILYKGEDIAGLSQKQMIPFRRKIQMIFQDPYASLDPRMTVGDIIGEAIDIHKLSRGKEREERINSLLKTVGLNSEHKNRYPHEFSGGQRQRIGIARALAVEPEFIICDEPISALDVSIQAQILNLLIDLQREMKLTYLFISHDLSVVKHISNRIVVMYLGKIVEIAPTDEIFANPLHPYTMALLSSIPIPDPTMKRNRLILEGDPPSPINPPTGCRFHTRCPQQMDICLNKTPDLKVITSDHLVYCHLYNDLDDQ